MHLQSPEPSPVLPGPDPGPGMHVKTALFWRAAFVRMWQPAPQGARNLLLDEALESLRRHELGRGIDRRTASGRSEAIRNICATFAAAPGRYPLVCWDPVMFDYACRRYRPVAAGRIHWPLRNALWVFAPPCTLAPEAFRPAEQGGLDVEPGSGLVGELIDWSVGSSGPGYEWLHEEMMPLHVATFVDLLAAPREQNECPRLAARIRGFLHLPRQYVPRRMMPAAEILAALAYLEDTSSPRYQGITVVRPAYRG